MAHIHSIYDTDPHFAVNAKTRALTNKSESKVVLVQFDHNSERITFELPRLIDGHDMSQCNVVRVHYCNVDAATKKVHKDVYEVKDLQLSPEDENVVICSWLISRNATQLVGALSFVLEFSCVVDGVVEYAWHTAVSACLNVSTGMSNGEQVVNDYADVLQQWRDELFSGGGGGSSGEGGTAGVSIQNIYQKTVALNDGGENIFVVELTDGTIKNFAVRNGNAGKSAYQYAQNGGYEGTEEEFIAALGKVGSGSTVGVDTTLTQSGKAADAKVVGDRFTTLSEEIEQQDEKLATLQGKAYKDYMEGEIAAVTERLQAIQYAAPNSTTFAFCTDMHYREYRDPVRLQNILGSVAAISKVCPVELIAFGGDNLADSKGDGQEALKLAKHFGDILYKNQEVIAAPAMGNHDDNTLKGRTVTGTLSDAYKLKNADYYTRAWRQIENIPGVCIGSREGLYYYVDLEAQKTRLIFLNCVDVPYIVDGNGILTYAACQHSGYSNAQLNWVANVALDFSDKAMPEDWIIATIQHYTDNPDIDDFLAGSKAVAADHNGQVMLDILHAFNARTSYTFERTEGDFACSVNCDYTNAKGKIICRISGHTHRDKVAVSNGILYISTIGAGSNDESPDADKIFENVPNTGDESGWDIFTIDMDHEIVHATRFGTGVSRTITFTGEVTYPETDEPVEPDEPDVPDEPATPTLPYQLAEPTVFDGSTTYIDTGIKLFENDIDYTIALRIDPDGQINPYEIVFYQSFKLWFGFNVNSGQYCIRTGSSDEEYGYTGSVLKTETEPFALVITHEAGSDKINYRVLKPDGTIYTRNDFGVVYEATSNTLFIGAQPNGTTVGAEKFWAGTMNDFQIHDRVWSDDEITAYLA